MHLADFLAGVAQLRPYYNEQDKNFCLGADHDVIYLYPTDRPLPEESVKVMHELGWFQEDVDEDGYDPEASWWAYV